MKRIATVLILALALASCESLNKSLLVGGLSPTASISNPVTPEMVLDVENGLIVVTAGLVTYKRTCVQRIIDQRCRTVIEKIQPYTRKAEAAIKRLRVFVRTNDQVNAIAVYNELRSLVIDITDEAKAQGVI